MRKKVLTFLLVLTMIISWIMPTSVLGATYNEAAAEAKTICIGIGMLVGPGTGVTEEYLDTKPARFQGAVMLLRLKGLYDTSINYSYSSNYNDYEDLLWAPQGRNLLGYLYANQESVGFRGYPNGSFKPYDLMTAKQYYKVMLVALGYVEGADFLWNDTPTIPGTLELAQSLGLTWLQGDDDFTVRDLAIATVEALRATYKDTTMTLAEKLIADGKIDPLVAESVGLITGSSEPEPQATINMGYNYETGVINGDSIITITLSNATFKSTVGGNNADTTALLDGIDGSLNTPVSWDAVVNLQHTDVSRVSDTQVIINVAEAEDYRIAEDEDLTITLEPSLFNEELDSALSYTATIDDVGAGTIDSPWQLFNPEDFDFITSNPETDYHYIMMNNMDFTGVSFTPIGVFGGIFDGNDKGISNLHVTQNTDEDYTAMFKDLQGGTIKDLIIQNSSSIGTGDSNYTAMLAGKTQNIASITNVSLVDVTVESTSDYTGGLVGFLNNATVENSIIQSSTITGGDNYTGGFFGLVNMSTIDTCVVTDSAINAKDYVGGIAGYTWVGSTYNNCIFSGSIQTSIMEGNSIGGIVGYMCTDSDITNCSSTGTITGNENIGGIVGVVHSLGGVATITDNYCGLDSITSIVDVTNLTEHRIVGSCTLSDVDLSNTASNTTQLLSIFSSNYTDQWVSDGDGVDGFSIFIVDIIIPIFEL